MFLFITFQEQLERMKDQFMTEIRELNERLHAAELAKDQFDHRQSNRSFLGDLTDDNDIEKENLRDQREQLAMLKEQLQDKVIQFICNLYLLNNCTAGHHQIVGDFFILHHNSSLFMFTQNFTNSSSRNEVLLLYFFLSLIGIFYVNMVKTWTCNFCLY